MPVTRKRQQQQRAQQQQLQQQQYQQQQQLEHHDKQNNNNIDATNGSSPSHQNQQSQQPSSKTPVTRAKAIKDNTRSSGDQINEKSAVHKDIQAILESDLYCAICREIYIDPLILNCAHSFCKFCLNHWLSKQVGCPSCRMVVVFQTENLALKDIVNKMIKTSSPEFQLERAQSLDQRSKAENLQKIRGVKPMMEKKSFNLHGQAREILNKRDFIRSWRGPNGATIWQTKLDPAGQIVRPEMDDVSSTDYDDDDDDDYDNDEDFDHEDDSNSGAGNLDVGLLGDLPTDDPDEDESAASTIDIDSSDASYLSDRRLQNHHLNILAGFQPDSDESFEVEASSNGHSDADSSMAGIMDDDSDESGREYIFVRSRVHGFVPRAITRSESSTEEEDEEEEEGPAAEEDENREAAFSSNTDYTSDSSNTSGSTDISYASEQSGEFDDDEDEDSNYVF